ncbi:MAG: hypothetical protein Q4C82_04235 [Eubacteriales bacterium]|nr:hypothetical protein [Eubacteriales bacterium]
MADREALQSGEYQKEQERRLEREKYKDFRETMDRLTAASHVTVDYFARHEKIEGYYESQMTGNLFGCDRLMKQDNLFGTLQLGYNPNRERVFLFANLKTSRYDTVASRYQKEMKEYQQRALLKGDNENRAYVSKRWENAAVLIEKKENKPWTARSVRTYLSRANTEAVRKTMPFFQTGEERKERQQKQRRRKEIQEQIRALRDRTSLSMEEDRAQAERERSEEIRALRREAVEGLSREQLLEAILIRKETAAKLFLRRVNYAYDFQKKDIELYYRERRKTLEETSAREGADEDEDRPEDRS